MTVAVLPLVEVEDRLLGPDLLLIGDTTAAIKGSIPIDPLPEHRLYAPRSLEKGLNLLRGEMVGQALHLHHRPRLISPLTNHSSRVTQGWILETRRS